ncbi:MAG: hypothetical protein GX414_06920 [Acidobacteria bacterium]|nr:hypothetical protein [Acidobacteriota bacterium]
MNRNVSTVRVPDAPVDLRPAGGSNACQADHAMNALLELTACARLLRDAHDVAEGELPTDSFRRAAAGLPHAAQRLSLGWILEDAAALTGDPDHLPDDRREALRWFHAGVLGIMVELTAARQANAAESGAPATGTGRREPCPRPRGLL